MAKKADIYTMILDPRHKDLGPLGVAMLKAANKGN
jgi:hypothetical protein